MSKKVDLFSWKWLLILGWSALATFVVVIVYHFLSGTFDVVDGGLAFAAVIIYFFVGLVMMGILHIVAKFLPKLPVLNRVIVAAIWLTLGAVFVLTSVTLYNDKQESTRLDQLETALEPCTVRSVEWAYQPGRTVVRYTDRGDYDLNGYVQPTQVEGLIYRRELICNSRIEATFDGVSIRRY